MFYNQIWADFQKKLWHSPQNLDDLYAWIAFFTAVGAIIAALQWTIRRAPILFLGMVVAWRLPTTIRSHSRSAELWETAAWLLNGGPLTPQFYVLSTITRVVMGYTCAVIFFVLGTFEFVRTGSLSAVVFLIVGTMALFFTPMWSDRRRRILFIAAEAHAQDLQLLSEQNKKLYIELQKPMRAVWPFSILLPVLERARSRLISASQQFYDAVERLQREQNSKQKNT